MPEPPSPGPPDPEPEPPELPPAPLAFLPVLSFFDEFVFVSFAFFPDGLDLGVGASFAPFGKKRPKPAAKSSGR